MMSAEVTEGGAPRPHQPSTIGMDARVEQLVSELRVKVGSVILRARSGGMAGASSGCYGSVSSSASSSPGLAGSGSGLLSASGGIPDVKRWFNIECAEADGLREELAHQCQQWRGEHGSGSFPPLCIEVNVSIPSSFSGVGPSSAPAEDGEATQHRIELWVMRFEPTDASRGAAQRASPAMETPVMYKRAVILVRTLYSLLRFLPGHKIASLHDASVGVAVSSRLLSVEESARALAAHPAAASAPAPAPAASVTTEASASASPTSSMRRSVFSAAAPRAAQAAQAAPTTSHAGQTFFNFGALDTPAGRLRTGVMYDSHRAEVVVEAFRHYAPNKDIVNRPTRVLSAPAARPFAGYSSSGRRMTVGAAAAGPGASVAARGHPSHRSASFSQATKITGFAPQSAPSTNAGAIVAMSGNLDITPTRYRKNSNEYPTGSSASGSDSGSFSTSSPPLPFSETPKSSHSLLLALSEDRPLTTEIVRAPPTRSPVVSSSFLEAAAATSSLRPSVVVQHTLSTGQPVRISAFTTSQQQEQEQQRHRLRLTYRSSERSSSDNLDAAAEVVRAHAGSLSASRHSAGGFDDDDDLPFALEGEHGVAVDLDEGAGAAVAGGRLHAGPALGHPRQQQQEQEQAAPDVSGAAARAKAPSAPNTSPQNMLRLVNDALMLKGASDGMPLRYAMMRIEQISSGGGDGGGFV